MAFTATDHRHMAHALALAERGLFTTQPNPRVGCVIAHGDAVVGEGWHERAGEAHAEARALQRRALAENERLITETRMLRERLRTVLDAVDDVDDTLHGRGARPEAA